MMMTNALFLALVWLPAELPLSLNCRQKRFASSWD
jgi:hypothetical protein